MIQRCFSALVLSFAMLASFKTFAQNPLFKLLPSSKTGITFRNDINETENLNVLAYEYFYNGGGVAVGDINNDGWEDLFFTANMGENKLYLNLGNMQFKDITKAAHPLLAGKPGSWKTGVTMADVNGDGLLDIYICYSGKLSDDLRRNQLFINKGNLQFEEKAAEYGLDAINYSTQASFFDYDNDGDLDMFLLNHSTKKIDNMELAKYRTEADTLAGDRLYRNNNNKFEDVSAKVGINQFPSTFGLGIAISDINLDGWQDIYVTNDYNEQDYIYINNKNGTFSEKSKDYLRHLSHFSMGVDIADFNNDGYPDIYTLDMLPEDNRRQKLLQLQENYEAFALMQSQDLHKQYMRNMLHLNNGDGSFSEIAQLAGVSNTDWSWCPLFADFDDDGYKDLFITNGYFRDYTNKDFLRYWGDFKIKKAMDRQPVLLMDLIKAMPVTYLSNYIYKNNGDLSFTNKKTDWGITQMGHSNGAVYADLDKDGDLDLVANNLNGEALIYENTRTNANAITFSVKYTDKNSFGVGTKLYVYTKKGLQYQEVNPNRGYLSATSLNLHFGLGSNDIIDSVVVIWPNNQKRTLKDFEPNKTYLIEYNPSLTTTSITAALKPGIFEKKNPLILYPHEDFIENDFKRQALMLFMYSKVGPVLAKGDVNKDGLEDLFISGDKNRVGTIYQQTPGGGFRMRDDLNLGDENVSITSSAAFADVNGDGFQDIYIAKGGYSVVEPGTPNLQDELYINDGKGGFTLGKLPNMLESSKSCVVPGDYDGDGDIDFFVGGRVIPGQYPRAPRSYLLNNDGKGNFTIVDAAFNNIGMITNAKWYDFNKDGKLDLIFSGEYLPITVFINTGKGFENKTQDYFKDQPKGFWFNFELADLDKDGEVEIIAGNLGNNSQIKASDKEPAEMYYGDFDNNGSVDPILNFYIQGVSYPYVSRDELNDQIFPMRRKFSSYKNYADATIHSMFTDAELKAANKWEITSTQSTLFKKIDGKYTAIPLPMQAQFSIITEIVVDDFDKDGNKDILLLGNKTDNRLKIGAIDANYGCLLKGDGKNGFSYVPQTVSGLSIRGDVKSVIQINVKGSQYWVVAVADQPIQFYQVK